ncbi:cancer-associated gene 1 protein [Nannospalax galili]|nr:cancer-associated gene 1 protein [Nannospalax galili]
MDRGSEHTPVFDTLRPSVIQQIEIRTIKGFGHHPWQHKKKLLPSSSDPVHFKVDASHEYLESMSDLDAVNISDPFQDLSHSDSLFGIGDSSITSDLPQSETKKVKRENECMHTHTEDICSTHDNLLGGVSIRSYSGDVQNQPANRISSLRQFEPICKFHWIEAFHDEMTFQNLTRDFSYSEKPEFQIQAYNDAEDSSMKQNCLQEENPMETSISANKDQLVHECVTKSPKSLSLNYYSRETLKFTQKPLAKNTAGDSALHPSQSHIFLYKESVCRNGESAFYHDNNFDLLDLRVNYKTEATEVSSKEIQTSREISEMPGSHQEEVTEDGEESLAITSSWSPAGIFKSDGASQENSMTPGMEQNFESFQPLEEDMALNEILQKLRHTIKMQDMQIQDLQGQNLHLESKVKELQMKQQLFVDNINKLKENIEELIHDKYNVILEKNEISKKFQDLQEISANTKKHLQESKKEKETLQLQVKKIKANCIRLQEQYIAEIQQKNRAVNQCVEMEKTLSKKDEELARLEQVKVDLEKAATSAYLLKKEKEIREQEFLSLQEKFQKCEKENLKERRKLKSRVEKLIAQIKNLLFTCENKRAKNTKLQQQIDELQQQVAKSEEQNCIPNFEIAPLAEKIEDVMEPDITQGIKVTHSNLILNCSSCDKSLEPSPVMKTPLAAKIHSLLTLMIGLLTCQDITIPDAEHCPESKKANDTILQKLKNFQLKKRDLDKELLKHKNRIAMLKELIANEKSLQDHTVDVPDFDADEARNVRDASLLLAAKLDKYHSLNEELDFLITKLGSLLESEEDHYSRLIEENDKYRRHVGSLINKVTSYEEIIKCADQRLEISHSQIAHLEKRNRHLEDIMRSSTEKARKPRSRTESHPKSMTLLDHLDGHYKECSISM